MLSGCYTVSNMPHSIEATPSSPGRRIPVLRPERKQDIRRIQPKAPKHELQNRYLTDEERYSQEMDARHERIISPLVAEHSKFLEKNYDILTSPEDGRIIEDPFVSLFGSETVNKHRVAVNAMQRKFDAEQSKSDRYDSKAPMYVEKFIPIALMEYFDYFCSETEDSERFYADYNLNEKEQNMFDSHINNVPYDILSTISAPYDDFTRNHKFDFGITGKFPLCGIDITIAYWDSDVYEDKEDTLAEYNIKGSSWFYGYKQDKDGSYKPTASVGNFPHLLLRFPRKDSSFVFKILENSGFSSIQEVYTENSKIELQENYTKLSLYLVRLLSISLRDARQVLEDHLEGLEGYKQTSFEYNLGRSIERTLSSLSLLHDNMTPQERGEAAIKDRFTRIGILEDAFYCMRQFALKKLELLNREV